MAKRVYEWGKIGIKSGQIDTEQGKIVAAILRGGQFRKYDKFLPDVLKRGTSIVVVSAPVNLRSDRDSVKDAPQFPEVSEAETWGANCIVFYQVSRHLLAPDLPPEQQRVITYADTVEVENGTQPEAFMTSDLFMLWQTHREKQQQKKERAA